jgi:uncharacterized repeat protein (TIGR01451 family)
MKNICKKATMFIISMILVSSSIAIADINNKQNVEPIDEYIVWDNDMDFDNLVAAIQPINPVNIDVYPADDFQLEAISYVTGVIWIGGFIDTEPEPLDWCIDIYLDEGTGELPGEEMLDSFCYSWEEINKTEINESVWLMEVELPYSVLVTTDKYWISIYAIGDSPPTTGWGYHFDTIKMSQAVFKSDYFGYSTWTLIEKFVDYPADLCFQIKSSGNYIIDVEKQVLDEDGEWQDCDTENEALDVKVCNEITFKIIIENKGDFPLNDIVVSDLMEDGLGYVSADPEPDDYNHEPPYHYFLWNFPGEFSPGETIEILITAHVEGPDCSINYNFVDAEGEDIDGNPFSDEDYCYIHAVKKSKTLSLPFINWLESHPRLFQFLQFFLQIFEI